MKKERSIVEQAILDSKKALKVLNNELISLQAKVKSRENRINYLENQLSSEIEASKSKIDNLLLDLFGPNAQIYLEGLSFEKHVVWWMDKYYSKYSLKIWQGDKSNFINDYCGDHLVSAEWNSYPDLIFVDEKHKKAIAIECKYRRDGILNLDKKHYDNYVKFQKEISSHMDIKLNVYIMVGTAGQPDRPDWMYCIPLESFQYKSDVIEINMRNMRKNLVMTRDFSGIISYPENVPF